MATSFWRITARIVAYFDLILSSLLLFIAICVVTSAAGATSVAVFAFTGILHAFVGLLWPAVALIVILACTNMWAAIMLLKATNLETEPKVALDKARIWKTVNIVYFVFILILSGGALYYFEFKAIPIIVSSAVVTFRFIFLFFVCKFIGQREQVIVSLPIYESRPLWKSVSGEQCTKKIIKT